MSGVAASVNDPTLCYNTAVLNSDVEERVRILMENG